MQMLEFDGQNACDRFEPVLHPATKPSPSPPPLRGSPCYMPTRSIAAGVRFRVPSADTALPNTDRKRKKLIAANQDVTDCLPKLFEKSIVAVSVNEKKKFFLAIFQKKRKVIFKKAESKKKSGIPPKSGRLTSLRDVKNTISSSAVGRKGSLLLSQC